MRKSKSGKNNNEHDKLELNNDLSDLEKDITEDGQILPEESYKLLIESGQAEKISPKASGMLTWQLAMSEKDNELYLRLLANGSGGLFSKDWVPITEIESVLENQPATGFTSGVFKSLFKGASANNAGFRLRFYAHRIYVCLRRTLRSCLRMFYMRTGGSVLKHSVRLAIEKGLRRINSLPELLYNQKRLLTTIHLLQENLLCKHSMP